MSKPDDITPEDDHKTPPSKPQEDLHGPEETLGDAPASDPKPAERSRLAD